jgi:MFS transporter
VSSGTGSRPGPASSSSRTSPPIIEAPQYGWLTARTLGGFAGALVLLAGFGWWQLRRPDPLLDVRLFRNPRFTAASGAIALAFFGLFGFIFLITQYFQLVRGYDPLRAGLATLPFAIVTGALSPVAIAAMKRAGTKIVVTAGLLLMSSGFIVAAGTAVSSAYWGRVIVAMVLMAAGLALTSSPATEAIMGALPRDKAGAGSAVNDTTRELGGTLGVAIVGSAMSSVYASHVAAALGRLGAPAAAAAAARQSVAAGLAVAGQLPPDLRAAAAAATRLAFMTGLHAGSLVAAGATAAAALATLAFLPARARAAAGTASPAPGAATAAAPLELDTAGQR